MCFLSSVKRLITVRARAFTSIIMLSLVDASAWRILVSYRLLSDKHELLRLLAATTYVFMYVILIACWRMFAINLCNCNCCDKILRKRPDLPEFSKTLERRLLNFFKNKQAGAKSWSIACAHLMVQHGRFKELSVKSARVLKVMS